jgi:hypothetical protein
MKVNKITEILNKLINDGIPADAIKNLLEEAGL